MTVATIAAAPEMLQRADYEFAVQVDDESSVARESSQKSSRAKNSGKVHQRVISKKRTARNGPERTVQTY